MDIQELLFKQNIKINIIGDSIAAGAGSTGAYKTEQLVFEDTKQFFRRVAPNPSVHSNEYYENRLYHTDEVVEILKEVAKDRCVQCIDLYQYILNYLKDHNQKIEDVIFNPDGTGDGLHSGDFMQKLMFEKIIKELGIYI